MCSDAPDYTPLANASAEAAEVARDLGQQQIDLSRQQYEQNAPLLRDIARTQISAMDQQMAMAADAQAYNQSTFRPLERRLVQEAEAFNTQGYRNQLAAQAAADAGRAFSQTRAANERAARSMGVNPNSGAARAMNAQSALGLSAMRGDAMNRTRNQARDHAYGMRMQAAGLGRGLPQQSLAAFQGATGSGSAAGNSAMAAGNQYMAGFGQGAGTIMQGQNMNIQGLGNVLNAQASYAGQSNAGIGGALGAVAGAGLMYATGGTAAAASDRRLKENVVEVGVDDKTGLKLYHFNYIDEPGRFEGVMADEVLTVMPEAVSENDEGFMMVDYAMLGIEMREVV